MPSDMETIRNLFALGKKKDKGNKIINKILATWWLDYVQKKNLHWVLKK